MKQNSNEHIVMSIAKTKNGIELNEDINGTLPELSSLLTLYLVHFCQHFSKEKHTADGRQFSARLILTGIISAAIHNIDDELSEEGFIND